MLLEIDRAAIERRLFPFSARVGAGELIHLVGPNGAGKSSLLAALSGLQPARGDIRLCGRPLGDWSGSALARRRAYLPQQQLAPAQMPVWHYLLMHHGPGAQADAFSLRELSAALRLDDKQQRPLGQLSGGEWQRVRLAAVLLQVSQPDGALLLLDEPLTGLDIAQQHAFDGLLSRVIASGISVVMSSHDLNHSLQQASSVWLMRPGQPALVGAAREILTCDNLTALYQVAFRELQVDDRIFLTTGG